jgi:hypothetical protein
MIAAVRDPEVQTMCSRDHASLEGEVHALHVDVERVLHVDVEQEMQYRDIQAAMDAIRRELHSMGAEIGAAVRGPVTDVQRLGGLENGIRAVEYKIRDVSHRMRMLSNPEFRYRCEAQLDELRRFQYEVRSQLGRAEAEQDVSRGRGSP